MTTRLAWPLDRLVGLPGIRMFAAVVLIKNVGTPRKLDCRVRGMYGCRTKPILIILGFAARSWYVLLKRLNSARVGRFGTLASTPIAITILAIVGAVLFDLQFSLRWPSLASSGIPLLKIDMADSPTTFKVGFRILLCCVTVVLTMALIQTFEYCGISDRYGKAFHSKLFWLIYILVFLPISFGLLGDFSRQSLHQRVLMLLCFAFFALPNLAIAVAALTGIVK